MVTPTPHAAEPLSVRRNDTAKWYRYSGEFPTGTWTLSYALRRASEPIVSVTATADSASRWLATITPAVSATLIVGAWSWVASVTDGTDRYTVGTGALISEPDLASDDGVDPRSFAERMVDILEARIENRAPNDIVAHSTEAISITVMSDAEARAQLDYWRRRVAVERNNRQALEGRGNRAKIYTRFTGR